MNPPWVYTCSHPEPPSHLPPHTIPLGHPSAPAPKTSCRTFYFRAKSVIKSVLDIDQVSQKVIAEIQDTESTRNDLGEWH